MATVFECMGVEATDQIKAYAKTNKVAIPEVVARLALHVLTSDDAEQTITDLLSDAPHSQRGRKALDPEVKAAKEAARAALKGNGNVAALRAAIDALVAAQG